MIISLISLLLTFLLHLHFNYAQHKRLLCWPRPLNQTVTSYCLTFPNH